MVIERFNKKHPDYLKIWRKNNPHYDLRNRTDEHRNYYHTKKGMEIIKKSVKKYSKSEKGKLSMSKHQSKRNRKLKFLVVSDNIIDEPIDYHHIDNIRVVAIPKDLHLLYSFPNREYHRFMCNQVVNQLYNRG